MGAWIGGGMASFDHPLEYAKSHRTLGTPLFVRSSVTTVLLPGDAS